MEPSSQPSESRRSDHDYFVSSETTNSWKLKKARPKDVPTPDRSPVIRATHRLYVRSPSFYEHVEEEMVENMMVEQEDAAFSEDQRRRRAGSADFEESSDSDSEDTSEQDDSDSDSEDSDPSDQEDDSEVVTVERKVSAQNEDQQPSRTATKITTPTTTTTNSTLPTKSALDKPSVRIRYNVSAQNGAKKRLPTLKNVDDSATCSLTSLETARLTDDGSDVSLTVESDEQNETAAGPSSTGKVCDSSTMSTASGDDSIEEPADEVDTTSDVSSSFAESESIGEVMSSSKKTLLLSLAPASSSASSSVLKKPRKRQPPIMIGYKKRRKVVHQKKLEDEYPQRGNAGSDGVRLSSEPEESVADDRSHRGTSESSSSEENASVESGAGTTFKPSVTRRSSSSNEPSDKYCWICHKDMSLVLSCLACPRVFHTKCYAQMSGIDAHVDPNNFQCPECVAVLKADNINTRSPTLATVNLDQLCVSLKHVIDLLKAQKDSHFFLGPVDTKEFPHYREYITHPMDLTMLEKNVSNKIYGCTEAFLADVKWIVHNSIVFNSKASKITNVAKNLLKICKREVAEIETCAECYYNSLVRIDTWFIEVCIVEKQPFNFTPTYINANYAKTVHFCTEKRPHILVWARLKGYPPWPAKALKCKDNMVDCRFFGAHDRAWVPLKDCFLYSEAPPQPGKIKKSNHLEVGIQELERHIFKLKNKFGVFKYPPPRTPYQPTIELEQIRLMLPNYDPKTVGVLATKYLIHSDRVKRNLTSQMLTSNEEENAVTVKLESADTEEEQQKRSEDADSESTTGTDDQDKPLEVPAPDGSTDSDAISTSSSETERSSSPDDEVPPAVQPSPLPLPKTPAVVVKSVSVNVNKLKDDSRGSSPSSKTSTADETRKSSEESVDSSKVARKYVVVKDINSINASVVARQEPSSETASKVSSSTSAAKVNAAAAVAAAKASPQSTAPFRSTLLEKLTAVPRKNSVEDGGSSSSSTTSLPSKERKDSDQFDLDKVKEEPMEVDAVNTAGVGGSQTLIDRLTSKKPNKGLQSLFTISAKSKREASNEESAPAAAASGPSNAKKLKPDSNLMTTTTTTTTVTNSVNLSKTVTLSVVNHLVGESLGRVKMTAKKQVMTSKSSEGGNELPTTSTVRSKSTPSPSPVARVVANANAMPVPSRSQLGSRSHVRILPRPPQQPPQMQSQTPTALTNGPSSVVAALYAQTLAKDGSTNGTTTANTLRVDSTSNKQSIQGLDEILLNEYQTHFKKFFEDTLEKIGGRGDLRAKIISLQKEMDTLKRSHEVFVDELRREYETQIAELRATCIAQTNLDLAAERLKFEQEKEKAVKEAKSKQWCSNCQKSANYYCCWNTAYCDFECQKEHWMSHMQVCKNDVNKKKAAAESSENEPPRIMMQNDVANNYILNGYDKPGTATTAYAYQNSNSIAVGAAAAVRNFKRQPQTKTTATKAGNSYRPLLPRISSTTNASSGSVSATTVSNSHLMTNSTHSFSENHTTYPAVSSTSNSLRPVPSAVPVRQFLK